MSLDTLVKELETAAVSVKKTMSENEKKLNLRVSATKELIEDISEKIGKQELIIQDLRNQLLDKTLESKTNKKAELEKIELQKALTEAKEDLTEFMEQNGLLQLEIEKMQTSYNTIISQTSQQIMSINQLMSDIKTNINLTSKNLDTFLEETNEDLSTILRGPIINLKDVIVPLEIIPNLQDLLDSEEEILSIDETEPIIETEPVIETEPIIEGEEPIIEGEEPIIEDEEPIIESSFGIDDSDFSDSEFDY